MKVLPDLFLLGITTATLAFGCSAPAETSSEGDGDQTSGAGGMTVSGVGGASMDGSGGDGTLASGGGFGIGGTVGAAGGAAPTGGGSGTGGETSACTPNPSGAFADSGDVILDETTCLHWQKATHTTQASGDEKTFAAMSANCQADVVGGYDDWRAPTVAELATLVTNCKVWTEPTVPWPSADDAAFEISGDYFTADADAGGDDHYWVIGTSSGGGCQSMRAGANIRCVRGTGTVPSISGCTAGGSCESW